MDKEQYKQRLHTLVEQLKAQAPELLVYLQHEIDDANLAISSGSRIEKIEKYLGLDYKLDCIKPEEVSAGTIDYSFVTDDNLRDQLISDFREMMRYRYGTRSHKTDFYEYCKYAHFEFEALTNYFMEVWSLNDNDEVDIETAKNNIRENWPEKKYEPQLYETQKTIEDIPYQTKIKAILQYIKIKDKIISHPEYIIYNISDVIENIRKTRNACSHRGKQLTTIINDAIENFELHKSLRTSSTGKSKLYDFSANREVKYYLWLRSEPWNDVIYALIYFSKTLHKQLNEEHLHRKSNIKNI